MGRASEEIADPEVRHPAERAPSGRDSVGPEVDGNAGDERGEGFTVEESKAIASEAQRGRVLDRELARDLDRAGSTAQAFSSRYIHDLGQRRSLPEAVERRLVREAIEGDRDARAQLVEAFLPLIGAVALDKIGP